MTTRLDANEIGVTLADVGDILFADCRTVGLALKLDDLRREIVRVLAIEPPAPRRINPGAHELARRTKLATLPHEAGRQAREQGAGDGLRVRDLEASVAAHGGRFAEVRAR